MKDAAYWIEKLGLEEHPEGGYFRETYRSEREIEAAGFDGPRATSTAIYYLMLGTRFSALHRIRSDEVWHFYAGAALTVHRIDPDGRTRAVALGADADRGEVFQTVVPAGSWFGATLNDPDGCSLVGLTVAPGFDFRDFEIGRRDDLLRLFPEHEAIILQLTR